MKRFFCSFIIILFAVTTYAEYNYDFSAESPSGHTLYYKLSNGEAIVVYPRLRGSNYYYTYSKPTGYLIIPDSVPYNGVMLPVTSIGDRAFYACTGLTSVELTPSLTSIGSSAFGNCSGLTSVALPSSLTSIGSNAFNGCTGLQRLMIADGAVVSLSSSHFSGCSSLRYIYIGSGVTSIGQGTFSSSVVDTLFFNARNCNCCYKQNSTYYSSLENLNGNNMQLIFGDSVEVLGSYAFYRRSFVQDTLLLPPSLTSIGSNAFENCTGLTSVDLTPSLTSIGSSAFENCTGLTSVELPPSLTSIGSDAFKSCSGLRRLVIADGAVVCLCSSQF